MPCNRADIQILLLYHFIGFVYFINVNHEKPPALDSVHFLEDFFSLAADLYADLLAQSIEVIRQLTSCLRGIIGIYDHHHVKIFLHNSL